MSEEKHIALELVRIYIERTTDARIFELAPEGVVNLYLGYLKELEGEKIQKQELDKIIDENGTYKFIFENIKALLSQDNNNYVLKDDLKQILGGLYV